MVDSGFLGASAESVFEETELCPVARLLTEAVVLAGKDETEDAVVGVEADCGVVRLLFELLRLC
jgi:hypothetical protein